MEFLVLVLIGAIWAYCGYLGYGYTLAYFQKQFAAINTRESFVGTKATATIMGIAGPIGLFVVAITHGTKYGRVYSYIDDPDSLFPHLRGR